MILADIIELIKEAADLVREASDRLDKIQADLRANPHIDTTELEATVKRFADDASLPGG